MDNMKLPHQHGEGQQTILIQKQLDHVDYFQTVAEVFKQLGDTTRIRMCPQYFRYASYVKSGSVTSSQTIEKQRSDYLPT